MKGKKEELAEMTGQRIKIKGFALKNGKLVKSKSYYPSVSAKLKAKDKKRFGRKGTT